MEQVIWDNLSTYGPIALLGLLLLSGFGIALGEEMVTVPAGMLIAAGRMDLAATALCAYVGVVSADLMWFSICRHYGTPLLHKPWFKRLVHPRRLLEGKHQLERRGAWLIVMARFIPSGRTSAITVAGTLHMPFWKFALATAGCVLITVPLQLTVGFLIGRGLGTESMGDLWLKMVGLVVLLVALVVLIAWWTAYRSKRRRLPRARAAWLRRFRPRVPRPIRAIRPAARGTETRDEAEAASAREAKLTSTPKPRPTPGGRRGQAAV
ncbi:MAG: DedA family protein [Planctomycetota bacterium]|nr:DedA family protein [Planctomycetota bacterium]